MTGTINYDKAVKNFIDELSATGHVSHRSYTKTSVTFHHNGGRLSHEGVLAVWQKREASAHFDVDGKGAVCQFVKVNEYAWAVGDTVGNQRTISIEMANSTTAPNWEVSETTWKAAARLAGWLFAKVIGRRPTKDNVFYHHRWSSTACAGPYMDKVYNQLLAEVQKSYDYFMGATSAPRPSPTNPVRKSNTQIAAEVWAGKWGSGDDRNKRLKAAGYNPAAIQTLVNKGVGKAGPAPRPVTTAPIRKSLTQVASEVIDGKWSTGDDRRKKLAAAGYNATSVQNEVNRQLGASSRKSVSTLAAEVIEGKWGNGPDRNRRLQAAGYSASAVQAEVNRRL